MSFLLSCVLTIASPDVLELEDGTRLLGTLRMRGEEGPITLLGAAGPLKFERASVRSMQRRADLLPKYRAFTRHGGELRVRLSTTRWCLDHGLWSEALDQLDAALLAQPESASALELLDRAAAEVELEGWCPPNLTKEAAHALCKLMRPEQPARSRVAGRWLIECEDPELRLALERLSASVRVELRRASLAILAAMQHPESLFVFIDRSLREEDEALRSTARQAALSSDHPDLVIPYARALRSSRQAIRQNALPVLESLQDPRAMAPLISLLAPRRSGGSSVPRNHIFVGRQISFVQDFEVEIAQGAVIAKPVIGVLQEGALLDVRATASSATVIAGRARVVRSLHRLSDRRFGDDFDAWRDWWEEDGPRLLAAHREMRADPPVAR